MTCLIIMEIYNSYNIGCGFGILTMQWKETTEDIYIKLLLSKIYGLDKIQKPIMCPSCSFHFASKLVIVAHYCKSNSTNVQI